MAVELAAAEAHPVVRWSLTTADSGTGADLLRTCSPLAGLGGITGRAAGGEGDRQTETAVEVQAQCVTG